MPSVEQIKEAIKQVTDWCNSEYGEVKNNRKMDKAIQTLLSLAQEVVEIKKPQGFEYYLSEKHAEQYIGTKDCMIDDFNIWVQELGADGMIEYGEKYANDFRLWQEKCLGGLGQFLYTTIRDRNHFIIGTNLPWNKADERIITQWNDIAQAIRQLFRGRDD